jgi:xanthine dehydrogenase accessory factor
MSLYQELADLESAGGGGVLCTIIASQGSTPRHEGSKMLVYPDGRFTGTVGGGEMEKRVIEEAMAALSEGKTRRVSYSMIDPKQGDPGVCGGSVDIYIEPLPPKPVILIIGAGHVGKAVAHLAKWLGFRVAISDDRQDFCNPQANPDGDDFYPVAIKDLPFAVKITPQTFIVMTTRGVTIDIPGLPALLDSPAAYIGIIGSKRRWMTTRKALIDQGISAEKIQRIQSPIGLELRAETPEEIAVSIMAEIIMLRNRGSGERMAMKVE